MPCDRDKPGSKTPVNQSSAPKLRPLPREPVVSTSDGNSSGLDGTKTIKRLLGSSSHVTPEIPSNTQPRATHVHEKQVSFGVAYVADTTHERYFSRTTHRSAGSTRCHWFGRSPTGHSTHTRKLTENTDSASCVGVGERLSDEHSARVLQEQAAKIRHAALSAQGDIVLSKEENS